MKLKLLSYEWLKAKFAHITFNFVAYVVWALINFCFMFLFGLLLLLYFLSQIVFSP